MVKVLVIDDDNDVRDSLAEALRAEGHAVACAENGEAALEQLRAAPADVIVLDLMMPVMDGRSFLAHLDSDPALAGTPVVVTTASGADADVEKACVVLEKPYQLGRLLQEIAVARERPVS